MAEPVDIKDRAQLWYTENPQVTLQDVSDKFDIPYETVRDWAKNEGWVSKRAISGIASHEQVVLQADGIRAVLYEAIVVGNPRNLADLVKAWNSTLDVQAPAEQVETVDRDSLI